MNREPLGFAYATRDLLIAMMIVFMAIAVFGLIAKIKAPGEALFQLQWTKTADADVDLWVAAPGNPAVGYSHPSDVHCNLLRDDLGRASDSESRNMELTVCRGLPDGEWIVNAMLYASHDQRFPVRATVSLIIAQQTVIERSVELEHDGDEETMFRFTTEHGHVVPGSINQLPKMLFHKT